MVFKIRDSSSLAYFSSSKMQEENRSVLLLQFSTQSVCGSVDVRGWRSLEGRVYRCGRSLLSQVPGPWRIYVSLQ
jgi:hypothetical protein